jgi:hypothetical protein
MTRCIRFSWTCALILGLAGFLVANPLGAVGPASRAIAADEPDVTVYRQPQAGPAILWTRQFGSDAFDGAGSVAVDGSGLAYVSGSTSGVLPGQTHAGDDDAFVRKYRPGGNAAWTRQFGSQSYDYIGGTAVDSSGSIYVAGWTGGTLPGQSSAGDEDAFVRKYGATGNVLWTRQFGTANQDIIEDVAVDSSGSVYVAGWTGGGLPAETSAGGYDAFVRKYGADGNVLWTRQFGTRGSDFIQAVAVDSSGNTFVAGETNRALPGQTRVGRSDAFVRKYGAAGSVLWTSQFGSIQFDSALGIAVDGSGNAYVIGKTRGAFPGHRYLGEWDVFLRKYGPGGGVRWTRQFGTAEWEYVGDVAVDSSGSAYVVGSTYGAFPGLHNALNLDAFVRKYGPSGGVRWTRQFGKLNIVEAASVATDDVGNAYVVGRADEALPGQTHLGDADAFVRKYTPGS